MEQIRIAILNCMEEVKAEAVGIDEVTLTYKSNYEEGDKIIIQVDKFNTFYWVKLDASIEKSMVYLTGDMQYEIPFGEKKWNLSANAFVGERNLVHVRRAYQFEWSSYRNLAYNPIDQHGHMNSFPHASANVETRGESVFAAMNAIDGIIAPQHHGKWPFQSWGINQNLSAAWKLEFGRPVWIDLMVVYLRADFPHDNWWERAKLTFSDGTEMHIELKKGGRAQHFAFPSRKVCWIMLSDLIEADDPSPFPALTQVEVYGTEG